MPDFEEQEREAFENGMKFMSEIMIVIGWETKLNELTREQALTLAEVAVNGYFEKMRGLVAPSMEEPPFP